jgi:hypothetical protein
MSTSSLTRKPAAYISSPRIAALRIAFARAPGEIVEQRRAIGAAEPAAGAIAPAREAFEVAAVTVERRSRQAALGPDRIDERLDRAHVRVGRRRLAHGLRAAFGGRGRRHATSLATGIVTGSIILWR